jgi:hypothetical protein
MNIKRSLNPFRRRVKTERTVLQIINSKLTECPALTGVTQIAISNWANSARVAYDPSKITKIYDLVISISQSAQLSVDCSRDVFSNDRLEKIKPITQLIRELEMELV